MDLPCAAASAWKLDVLQPCAEDYFCSKSKRRRLRERRVAIRHSQLQTLKLKEFMMIGDMAESKLNPNAAEFQMRADAADFYPQGSVQFDWESLNFILEAGDVLDKIVTAGTTIPARRNLRDTCTAEALPLCVTHDAATCIVVCGGEESGGGFSDSEFRAPAEAEKAIIESICMGRGRGSSQVAHAANTHNKGAGKGNGKGKGKYVYSEASDCAIPDMMRRMRRDLEGELGRRIQRTFTQISRDICDYGKIDTG